MWVSTLVCVAYKDVKGRDAKDGGYLGWPGGVYKQRGIR